MGLIIVYNYKLFCTLIDYRQLMLTYAFRKVPYILGITFYSEINISSKNSSSVGSKTTAIFKRSLGSQTSSNFSKLKFKTFFW